MYQRLGNLYTSQRLGSFEGEPGVCARGRRNWARLSNEQLADRLAKKEMQIVKLQQRIAAGKAGANAARRLARLQERATMLRDALAARKNPTAINGLGAFDCAVCNPMGLAVLAAAGVGAYWFLVRPRMARRRKR
jgi:hypothetical protein